MSSIQFPQFTASARRRWEQVPEWARPKILESVWCGTCRRGTPIQLRSGRMKGKYLILKGICIQCGNEVLRVLEPEE